MKILKKRAFAKAVLIASAVFSIMYGGYSSLKDYRNTTTDMFYYGTDRSGTGIQSDLDTCVRNAANLSTVASRYLSENSAEITDLRRAADRLSSAGSISAKASANRELFAAAETLYNRLLLEQLSSTDEQYAYEISMNIVSANTTMANDNFNRYAERYNSALKKFPASLVSAFTSVEKIELFR